MVSEDVDGTIAMQLPLDGESFILLVEIVFQESFIWAGLDGRNTVQAGGSVQRQVVQGRLLLEAQFASETPV